MNKKLIFNIYKSTLLITDINDIIYFEKNNRKIKVYLRTYPKEILIQMNLKNLCTYLENKNLYNNYFFKPHNSYILNINYIKIINTTSVFMFNGDEIPISNQNKINFTTKINEKFKN